MPIPQNILDVERPKNSIVVAYGKNKDHYAVRECVGCKYDKGRRIPVNGSTIGHIINNVYVPIASKPIPEPVSMSSIDLKDWANVVLCDNVAHSLLDELMQVYNPSDAKKLYCASILRVCEHGIKDYKLKAAYENSFLSELFPDVAMSKNTVSKFWSDLGKAYSKIVSYMQLRVSSVEKGHHMLVDGTLKSNESRVNSLSDYSRKARLKGSRDISVLFAYDLERQEPICSKCFPGNMPDSTAYSSFIEENNIKKGILVGDKGFPSSVAKKHFAENHDLHYLNPLKRDSKYIKEYDPLVYEGQLEGYEGILYKRVFNEKENKCLYSFRDTSQAHKEEYTWLHNTNKKGNFDIERFDEDWLLFGTIILESDLEMDILTAYRVYDSRWEIELVMRYYKQACEFDETRVHSDYSVIGSEFCSFLSTIITYRLLNKFDKANLLKKMSYKKIMHILLRAKKVRIDGNDWKLINLNPSQIEVLQELCLIPKPEKKKRGRKPKE